MHGEVAAPARERRRRQVAVSYGVVRVGLGTALVVAPSVLVRRFGGGLGDGPRTLAALRLLGVRDLVLGAGMACATRSNRHARTWARLGVAADLSDLVVAGAVSPRLGRVRSLLVASAASGGILTGWWLGEGLRAEGRHSVDRLAGEGAR